eukprot:3352926-Amphidinium_carterae.1
MESRIQLLGCWYTPSKAAFDPMPHDATSQAISQTSGTRPARGLYGVRGMAQEKAVQPTSTTRTSDEPASQAPSSRTSGMNLQKRASACTGVIGML